MANEMMAVQHGCEGLLRFILPNDTVTIDMEVMTLKGVHIFKQDKHSLKESKGNYKEFLEAILDQDLTSNFRPKQPCRCPKVARLSDSQFFQDSRLKMNANSTETT